MGRPSLVCLFALTVATGCAPASIVGPLSHQEEERELLFTRAQKAQVSTDLLEQVMPPPTPEEKKREDEQDSSCRASYLWKNGLTYTGSALVAGAAGLTIGGAYATGNGDTTKAVFGVTGGTLALFGTMLVAIGGILQNNSSDRGCVPRIDTR